MSKLKKMMNIPLAPNISQVIATLQVQPHEEQQLLQQTTSKASQVLRKIQNDIKHNERLQVKLLVCCEHVDCGITNCSQIKQI